MNCDVSVVRSALTHNTRQLSCSHKDRRGPVDTRSLASTCPTGVSEGLFVPVRPGVLPASFRRSVQPPTRALALIYRTDRAPHDNDSQSCDREDQSPTISGCRHDPSTHNHHRGKHQYKHRHSRITDGIVLGCFPARGDKPRNRNRDYCQDSQSNPGRERSFSSRETMKTSPGNQCRTQDHDDNRQDDTDKINKLCFPRPIMFLTPIPSSHQRKTDEEHDYISNENPHRISVAA